MSKYSSTRIPLPMPKTSKEKFAIYLNVGGEIEMFLYDGEQVFTPDFPDIPIEKFQIEDGRTIRQETLSRICRYMLKQCTIEYNKEYDVWEAVLNDPF